MKRKNQIDMGMKDSKTLWLALCLFCMATTTLLAQSSSGRYVPCDELPDLMTKYQADQSSLVRFYSPATAAGRWWGRVSDAGGSPERRARYVQLRNDYIAQLEKLDFASLPQECKVDYILFKRDLERDNAQAKEKEA